MGLLKVRSAQNVEFDFATGNVGQRILAAVIDLILLILYVWFIQFAFKILLGIRFFSEDPDILFFFVVVLPITIYLPVSEYFWNGRTVGKYLLKLRVVRFDGSSATLSDFILRWLLRTIDVKLGFLFIFFIPRYPSSETESTTHSRCHYFNGAAITDCRGAFYGVYQILSAAGGCSGQYSGDSKYAAIFARRYDPKGDRAGLPGDIC